MHINYPSLLTFALILAVTQSTTSYPIRTSKCVKTEQFQDPNTRGIWKVFEQHEEGYDLLPDPPHVKYNGNPAWPTNEKNEPTEQDTPNDRYTTGTSESRKPVSILILESPEIPDQMILKYLRTKNALNNEHEHTSPPSFSSSSGSSRFTFTTLRSNFPQYPLPGVSTTVITLLVLVWIVMFIIGLLELANYLWRRREQALVRESVHSLHDEEEDVGFNETTKMPLRIVITPPRSNGLCSVGEYEYEFLESVSSDYESDYESDSGSDSGSESDEFDYRIF
ncbi:uncharacterized protein N7518_006908 [Penicillium psychrosexuale]|uniref:uncharacterized protein n=1 Tax=Penicillium psychrosexuale TaxID=1002107 RepID=UPI002545BD7D|nr:uncharacterized protein N7518_006908 [Penicillium psychrosexuale]KAJ5789897.1 hypothetical protein N7518_006908 [Penicillium psychrosexuale]